jgi:hypothetical protein
MVPKNFGVLIFRCDHYAERTWKALGQLIRFMVALTHSMFALPFMGAEAFILSL